MIYEFLDSDAPIRQGDVFVGLPRVEISLNNLSVISEGEEMELVPWNDIVAESKNVSAILPLRPVAAIVITQDCDTIRSPDITLCEVQPIRQVDGSFKNAKDPSSWTKLLVQQTRRNAKWFYLPPENQIGFTDRMAVDFSVTLRVAREDLWNHRQLRKGRLNPEADEHFRERLAEFFRRYPYDEWYPLDVPEFAEYKKIYPEAQPRPWQISRSAAS